MGPKLSSVISDMAAISANGIMDFLIRYSLTFPKMYNFYHLPKHLNEPSFLNTWNPTIKWNTEIVVKELKCQRTDTPVGVVFIYLFLPDRNAVCLKHFLLYAHSGEQSAPFRFGWERPKPRESSPIMFSLGESHMMCAADTGVLENTQLQSPAVVETKYMYSKYCTQVAFRFFALPEHFPFSVLLLLLN